MLDKKLRFQENKTTISFLSSGDLDQITHDGIMINQLNANFLDGNCNQIYLRIYTKSGIVSAPMIGSNSDSRFFVAADQLTWQGVFHAVSYQVAFKLAKDGIWFWQVTLSGDGQAVDVIYGQDIGNAAQGAVQANEAYMSQYVDHHVTQDETNIVISSRQNQPQNGKFPLVEQGSLSPLVSYATDGYQFFGTLYKETNQPTALSDAQLANEVYQYEFAYIALQTGKLVLKPQNESIVFYGVACSDQPTAVSQPVVDRGQIVSSYQELVFALPATDSIVFNKTIGSPIVGETLSDAALGQLFSSQSQVEKAGETTLSFFTTDYHHVVLKAKEVDMERAHGHILLSGMDLAVDKPLLSTTLYMYGIFNSQVVLGNTSMNKLMSNSRNSLNIMKQSGQRIYLKEGDTWRLLTMPSAFEMGLNSATWYYKLPNDLLKVTTFTVTDGREIQTQFESEIGKSYTLAITNQLLMSDDEHAPAYSINRTDDVVTVKAKADSVIGSTYPDLTYHFSLDVPYALTDERLFQVAESDVLTVFLVENMSSFTMTIQGNLTGASNQTQTTSLAVENARYTKFIAELTNHFHLSHPSESVNDMNTLMQWYTHNMLVHYLSPHGLEQYGGAAWGTRDVSQGPTEFFLAVNRPDVVASIITHVFENQFEDDGNWPQWFMFDRYDKQKADESHGDVIVWPMKIVADYLEKTADLAILSKAIPYTDRSTFAKTGQSHSLLSHIKKEIAYIEANFLPGTYLSCYGDGDWDDTLQPYDSRLKQNMASSWTVALTYQVLTKLGRILLQVDAAYGHHLIELANHIKQDFDKYMLGDATIPGFVYMNQDGSSELMIHPKDQKTGIQYRLLPMTRSMIAELLTPEQVSHHLSVIKTHLQFPDGVRLMNRPAAYHGGVSTNFKRAEQAANFGREVGLQYVHAHIRFTEAMAKIGQADETWRALSIINPVQIQKRVANAGRRQSNAYFSSSDGAFKTRYQSQAEFDTMKSGSTQVKGGWRIYSSGPGIYINQLLTSVLGIRQTADQIVFDPILPETLDGLEMRYRLLEKAVIIKFHLRTQQQELKINGQKVSASITSNPYRQGGLVASIDEIDKHLTQEINKIDIYC